nr:hypothetical protein [Tanacetum cinerariifolium]
MSRDVITVGSTMRIPLLYRGEYSQWRERFMNYLEGQTDGEAMINYIQNGDQPLPVSAQVSLAQNAPPTLKDPKSWTAEEKKTRKIDRLARSLLIQGLPNDIYSLIDSNETAKDLWDALERQMCGLEYVIDDLKKYGYKKDNCELNYKFLNNLQPEWKQYGTLMRQTKNLMDINIDALYDILKQNKGDVNDSLGYKKKAVVVHSDPLALVAEKTDVSKRKEKVGVSPDSEGSGSDDFSELKKITALLEKAFNQRKFYSKPINNNLRTSSTSQSANKKQEFVKTDDKKVEKKADEKIRNMSKVMCYNCKKEGHFAKDCKKAKVKDYNYYKTKMLLDKKDSDEQVLLAEDQAWMESSSDSDQEINANMVFMAQIEKDFNTKFYNSLGRAPNRCSSSIGKTRRVVIVYSGNRLGRLDQDYNHGSFEAFPSYEAKHRLEIRFHVEKRHGFLQGVRGTTRSIGNSRMLRWIVSLIAWNSSVSSTKSSIQSAFRIPRKGQNRIKIGQKQEAWQSQEKFKPVTVDKGRKTEENAKRMV